MPLPAVFIVVNAQEARSAILVFNRYLKKVWRVTRNLKFQAERFDEDVKNILTRVRQNPLSEQFVQRFVSKESPSSLDQQEEDFTLLLVPGAFAREYPRHDAAGKGIIQAAKALGLNAQSVPMPSFCSVSAGAAFIRDFLSAWPGGPVILVSLSKGATDTMHFLYDEIGAAGTDHASLNLLPRIRAWVTISGLPGGTHLVSALQRERVRYLACRALLKCYGYKTEDLLSLDSKLNQAKWTEVSAHLSIPSFHLVSFPSYNNLSSPLARRSVRRLWPWGVSDGGGVLLQEVLDYPGTILPLPDYDHYLHKTPVIKLLDAVISTVKAKLCF